VSASIRSASALSKRHAQSVHVDGFNGVGDFGKGVRRSRTPLFAFPFGNVPILAEIERREVLEEARLLIELEFNQKGR